MFLIAWHLAAKILIAFNKGNNGQWRFCHTHTHTHTHTHSRRHPKILKRVGRNFGIYSVPHSSHKGASKVPVRRKDFSQTK